MTYSTRQMSVRSVQRTLPAGIAALFLALFAAAASGQSCISSFSDDFNDGVVGSEYVSGGGCSGSAVESGGVLELTKDSCFGAHSIALDDAQLVLCGDFDVRVDFDVSGMANDSCGARATWLGVRDVGGAMQAEMGRYNIDDISCCCTPAPEVYKASILNSENCSAPTPQFAGTTDDTGRFRITRVGSLFSCYYLSGSAWELLHSGLGSTADQQLYLSVYGDGCATGPFTVFYDNLTITTPQCVTTLTDDFENGVVDPPLIDASGPGGSISETGGELVLTRDSGFLSSAGAAIDPFQQQLCNDFDVQIDFDISAMPTPPSGLVNAGLQIVRADDSSLVAKIERINEPTTPPCGSSNIYYKAWTSVSGPDTCLASLAATTDDVGKFRIRRIGAQFDMMYWDAGSMTWQTLRSESLSTDKMIMRIVNGSSTYNGGWSASFDNLLITSGPSDPRLDLVDATGSACYEPGDQITVELTMADIGTTGADASGYQAFLSFDDSALSFVSGSYVAPQFGLHVLDPIAAVGNEIDLAAVIDLGSGQMPDSSDAVLAALTFDVTAPIEACDVATAVQFRSTTFGTTIADGTGAPIPGVALNDLPTITIDGAAPALSIPSDITVNADAGGCTATLDPGMASANDGCDPMPIFTGTRDDGQPLSAPYPQGDTTITWTATDACGNEATADQIVTVLPNNTLDVAVGYDGSFTGTTFNRCITFELYPTGCGTPETVDAVLTFVDGVAVQSIDIPCGDYECITAVDPLHSLRRTDDDGDFAIVGTSYACDFTATGTTDDALVQGNLNGDDFIDILDFGTFVSQFGTDYGTADTDCTTPAPHGDFTGDGVADTADVSFIVINFLELADTPCCATLLAGSSPAYVHIDGAVSHRGRPLRAIAVRELHRRGLHELAIADLNGDGWLDGADVTALIGGATP